MRNNKVERRSGQDRRQQTDRRKKVQEAIEEKNKLEWVELNEELLDNNKFGGNYNIPHIITQIKVFLKNGTGLGKY